MEQLRFPRIAEEASAECRYAWIEDRIRFLAEFFAVSACSYAVAQATQPGRFRVAKKHWLSADWRVQATQLVRFGRTKKRWRRAIKWHK